MRKKLSSLSACKLASKTELLYFCAAALCLFMLGCGAPATDLSGVQVLYSGPAYGDFIEIAASIKQCMHSDIETLPTGQAGLPTLTIVSSNFRCNTPEGWVDDAWGCYAWGEVTVSLPRLELTHGQAWAHELTHFYGDLSEGNGCGNFFYSGFDWKRDPSTSSGLI